MNEVNQSTDYFQNEVKLVLTTVEEAREKNEDKYWIIETLERLGVKNPEQMLSLLTSRKTLIEKGESLRINMCSFEVGSGRFVEVIPNEEIRLTFGKGQYTTVVYGTLVPQCKIWIDGEPFYRVDIGRKTGPLIVRAPDLVKTLEMEGRIAYQKEAKNVVSTVLHRMAVREEQGYATYGVYAEGGRLIVCEDPLLPYPEQETLWRQIRAYVKQPCSNGLLQDYVAILGKWHDYEILPALGGGLAAPFSPILRNEGISMPHHHAYSPEASTGKTASNFVGSKYMFGVPEVLGKRINSDFRFATLLNQGCFPQAVEEADAIDSRMYPDLKGSADHWQGPTRGRKDLGQNLYYHRMTLLLSANTQNIDTQHTLKRFLVRRFESDPAVIERERRGDNAKDFDKKIVGLKPLGFEMIRAYVEKEKTTDRLLADVKQWASDFSKERTHWEDPTRPQSYAVVYLGLRIFEHSCELYGVDWKAPTIQDFCRTVVDSIEDSTWGQARSNVDKFRSWFAQYRVDHTKRAFAETSRETYEVVAGEGVTWAHDFVEWGNPSKKILGFRVTCPLLDEYNRRAEDNNKIPSLRELATQSANERGVPLTLVMDITGKKVKVHKIGGVAQRAAFVSESSEALE